jgi:hypothetical protein
VWAKDALSCSAQQSRADMYQPAFAMPPMGLARKANHPFTLSFGLYLYYIRLRGEMQAKL